MTISLHTWTRDDCDADTVLKAAAASLDRDGEAVALLYTPRCCVFARLPAEGELLGPPEHLCGKGPFRTAAVDAAYEIRIFTAAWEFRWLRQGTSGQAAVLWDIPSAETPRSGSLRDWTYCTLQEMTGIVPQQYLLWGKPDADRSKKGWTALTAARIGTLWVPLQEPPPDNKRVALKAREYLARRAHGNVVVADQRLLELAVVDPEVQAGDCL